MSAPHFKFRLQRLLDLRELAEREAAVALASAKAAEDDARRDKDALEAQRAAARAMLMPPAGSQNRVSELRQVSVLLERLDAGTAQAEFRFSKAERHVQQRMAKLGETVMDRRVLDRLKERQRDAWRIADERMDREVMDGIGRARFGDRADSLHSTEE
jgi:flagellar FliJ protein